MSTRIFVLFLLAFAPHSYAAVTEFKPLAMETKPGDTMAVRGFDGDVKIMHGKAAQVVVKVRLETSESANSAIRKSLDEWNFSMQRGETGIEISVQSPHTKEVWREILKSGGAPKYHLEVTAPSMPLELVWRNGNVTLDNWSAKGQVSIQQGQVTALGGSGDLRAVGQEANITVRNRAGKVDAESYSGKVLVDSVKGSVEAESFTGEATVQRSEGQIAVRGFKAPLTVTGGKGRIDFETVRGPVKVNNFGGDLRGTTDEAPVTAKLAGAENVRITSGAGSVTLDLVNSGASVSATSTEGSITGPPHLRADQMAGQKVMRGRLKGAVDGSVVVRSQSGPIRIR
jgi:DUF4097 and DUF4098 domain-containing protein YvlB